MSSKQTQLFRIIGGLNATEKAYFKKYGFKAGASHQGELKLFNLIDKQVKKEVAIDEERLIKSLKCSKANYAIYKSRLLQHLLKSLTEYDSKENSIRKIQDYIGFAQSLSKRKLFEDAKSYLKKAEKLAEELEEIELLIYIKSKLYLYKTFTFKFTSKEYDTFPIDDIQQTSLRLQNKIESDAFAYEILHFQKAIGIPRTKEELAILNSLKENDLFKPDYLPQLNTSKLDLAIAKSGIFLSLGNAKDALTTCVLAVENYQPHKNLRKKYNSKYLSLFDVLLQSALLAFDLSSFEKYNAIFQKTTCFGDDDKNLKQGIDLYAQSIYAIISNQLEGIKDLVNRFHLVKEESYIPNYRKISLAYYMAFAPFLINDYAMAYDVIQWLKNNRKLGIRYDIEVAILSMECIILLEQEEVDLLSHQLRSFYEFLKLRERKFEMENAIMRLLRNWMSVRNQHELRDLFKNSFDEMTLLVQQNQNERAFLNSFDILSWLESKLSKTTFREVYYGNNIAGRV